MRRSVPSPYPLTQNSALITQHFFEWRRGWAFEVAFAETARAPTEVASPLVSSPRRGRHPPRSPLFESRPLKAFILSHTLAPYVSPPSRFHVFSWRRGWAFEVAFAETARAPTERASPLVSSPRRGRVRDPPCSNPTLKAFILSPHSCPLRLTPHVSRLQLAERVGIRSRVR